MADGTAAPGGAALHHALFRRVDGGSLAAFRIAFGLLMLLECARFLSGGRLHAWCHEPSFHFTYTGFGWVAPWPPPFMHVQVAAMALLALGLVLGVGTRLCAALFGLGFLHLFLIEKARYLNHYYLVLLLCALLVVVPSSARARLPARRPRTDGTVPVWGVLLLRAQVGLVYLHAGLAKLNADWLAGRPLESWLTARADHPVLGALLGQPWAGAAFSYAGLALDLLAWPALCLRATRVPMFLALLAFHLTNSTLFGIGIFPWLAIAATTVFFPPDWPARVRQAWRIRLRPHAAAPGPAAGGVPAFASSATGASCPGRARAGAHEPPSPAAPGPLRRRAIVAFVAGWIAFQALFPLRHLAYPGSVHWTEEGHAFSWHMKLRGKSGQASFRVTDPASGETLLVDPSLELLPWQARKMASRPDMLLQFAHHLAERFSRAGGPRVEVRVTATVSLNGHPPRLLVDPSVDLAARSWSLLRPSPWITR